MDREQQVIDLVPLLENFNRKADRVKFMQQLAGYETVAKRNNKKRDAKFFRDLKKVFK